jgi:hypothetical protein
MATTQTLNPELKTRRYQRWVGPRHYVSSALHQDAYDALRVFMRREGLSASGAVHHLVRIGLGLEAIR